MVHANIPAVTLVDEETNLCWKEEILRHQIYQEKSYNHPKKMVTSEAAEVAANKPHIML